ncbi:hypothetical protein TWF481_006249 [Arthrobotrys musiformis]|uniref:SPK domain-containing protein n=1 Tax=Arthrobotrys musiformis TaxID=47236 RepID=A0AAV9WG68_9PEZI
MAQYVSNSSHSKQTRTISEVIDAIAVSQGEGADGGTEPYRAILHEHFHHRLGQLYNRAYGSESRYIPGETRVSFRIMNFLMQDLVEEYINETCSEAEECWTQICSPRSMKSLIKSKIYPMSVAFHEILKFRSSITENHPSTNIRVSYTGKKFVVSKLNSDIEQQSRRRGVGSISGKKRKVEESEWELSESPSSLESDTDADTDAESSISEGQEKGD